jgi:hypothetical protein
VIRFALGALPLIAFLVWIAALYFHHGGRRNAVLQAAALLGLWVMVGTEGLSAINALSFVPILIWWIIALIVGLLVLSSDQTEATAFASRSVPPGPRRWDLWLVSGLLITVLGLALASAVLSPPNNYDSYSYHLVRQVMWLQHGNVRHYPTVNLRQLMMAPFTEFVGVHLMALSNSDRWINLVQYASLLVTLCGVSLLTERLGGDRSVQVLACLLLVVSPVVFLEASNTKNDMLVAMWLVISVFWLIGFLDGEKMTWFKVLLMGSAIGCGGDTKGTGGLFLIPIVAVLAFAVFRRCTPRNFKMLCAMGILALAINLPQFGRNFFAFGHIDGPTVAAGSYPLYNEVHGPAEMLSNATRLLVWEAAIGPDSKDESPYPLAAERTQFDAGMVNALAWLHEHVLHLGLNDKRTTTPYSAYTNIHYRGVDEDRAGAPALIALILLLPLMLWLAGKRIDMPMALLVSAVAILGFLIFNWAVKWQEWHVRYFIAQIALLAPVLAVAFTARFRGVVLPLLACAMCAVLVPTICTNVRGLFGPGSLLARDDPRGKLNFHYDLTRRFTYYGHQRDFMDVARLVESRSSQWVGIATNGDFPDYAIMYTIKYRTHHLPNFEYINAPQPRKKIPGYEAHVADLIVADAKITHLADRATGVEYVLYRGNSFFNILLPKGDRTR